MGQRNELRVFISSTFRDLHEERDILVRKVFPEIRALCRQRGVVFTDVDLRWGLTDEDLALGQVIGACLEEIDRCRPYFIGITGETYGYIPATQELYMDPQLLVKYPWLEHAAIEESSIMDMEFRHAALNDPAAAGESVAFFFRRSDEVPTNADEYERLKRLHERVRSAGFHPHSFREAGTLAELVREYLLRVIERDFPDVREPTLLEKIRQEHQAFAMTRRQAYIPNPAYLKRLDAFVESQGPPLVVYAESGSGKSALLSYWAEQWRRRHPEAFVVEHYVGVGAGATDHWDVIRHVLLEIKDRHRIEQELPDTPDALEKALPLWLAELQKETLVLILDGVNQLAARGLEWLPSYIPPRVRLIVSTTVEQTLVVVRERGWQQMGIQPLTEAERRAIIVRYLAEYRKALSREHIERLAHDPKCAHALFLRTVLEELRLFGVHEELSAKLEEYLSTTGTEDLFQRVVERMEEDFGVQALRQVMRLVWASRDGMSEQELCEVGRLSRLKVAAMRASLDYHVIERQGRWGFFHDYLRRAVEKRYIPAEQQQSLHRHLGEYFQRQPMSERVARELPWQWEQAGDAERFVEVLSSVELLVELCRQGAPYELLGYWMRGGRRAEMVERYRAGMKSYCDQHSPDERLHALLALSTLFGLAGEYVDSRDVAHDAIEYSSQLSLDDEQTINLLTVVGRAYWKGGWMNEGEQLLQRALDISLRTVGKYDLRTATLMCDVAVCMVERDSYRQAASLREEALAVTCALTGEYSPEAAVKMVDLATTYSFIGDYHRAGELYQRALHILSSTYSLGHPLTIKTMQNYAIFLAKMRRFDEAETQLQHVREMIVLLYGEQHPDTIFVDNSLAVIYLSRGKYADAERLFRQILAIALQNHGSEHPATWMILSNLARALDEQGRWSEAIEIHRSVLVQREATSGLSHPLTIHSMVCLGMSLLASGDIVGAKELFDRIQSLEVNDCDPGLSIYLHIFSSRIAEVLGDTAAAQAELNVACQLDVALTGEVSNATLLVTLGDLAAKCGDRQAAQAHYRRAVEKLRELNPEHPKIAPIEEKMRSLQQE